MAFDINRFSLNNVLQKARDLFGQAATALDRDKSMSGFQVVPGGLGAGVQRVTQAFQQYPGQFSFTRPISNMNMFNGQTLGQNASQTFQDIKQNPINYSLPGYMAKSNFAPFKYAGKGVEGALEGATANIIDIPAPKSTNLGEKAAYTAGNVMGMFSPISALNLAGDVIKGTPIARGIQKPLENIAGKIAQSGKLGNVASKAISTLSENAPYTMAYAGLKQAASPITKENYTASNLSGDIGVNLALGGLGSFPILAGLSKRIKAKRIQKVLDNEFAVRDAIWSANNYNKLGSAADQIKTIDKLQSLAQEIIPEVANNKEVKKLGTLNPKEWMNTLSKFLEDALVTAKNPNIDIGFTAKKLGKLASNRVKLKVKVANRNRGFVTSALGLKKISKATKLKISGEYTPKLNKKLMGEAQALLQEGASIKIKGVKGIDKKIAATIQQAINLDRAGDHEAAANLFNNLSKQGTELGRGVQAFSLLKEMSPEAIALSAAGKINRYNAKLKPGKTKIPKLSGEQVKEIANMVTKIDSLSGREKNIAINELKNKIDSYIPSSFADKAITVWKAGLLTSLRTHERNLLGTTIMAGAEVAKDVPATLYDKILSLRTGKRFITPTLRGVKSGGKKGIRSAYDIVKYGYDPEETINKFDIRKVNWGKNWFEQGLKKYTDTIFNTLAAEDKPFWNAMFARSLFDQAGAGAINAGKHGDMQFISKLVDNPSTEMLAQATRDADYATFHDRNILSETANAFKRVANKNEYSKLVAEGIVPFSSVPSSIVGKTIAYSPIGLINGIREAGPVLIKNIPELQRQAAQDLGRGTIGSAIFALGAFLMSKGLMTGEPKDSKEAKLWQAQGKQRDSLWFNGKWRSINSIGPQNLILLAGAKYNQYRNDPNGSLAQYGAAMGKDQLNQTFLQGVQGPLQAINDPNRFGKSYAGRTLGSVVPNIVKDTSKAFDPTARESSSVLDYAKQGIPGLRNTMPPRRTVLGDKIPQEPTGVGAFIDLFNSKKPIDNAVLSELDRLNQGGLEATPSRISKKQRINKKDVVLTPQALDLYEKSVGAILKNKLPQLIQSQKYQSLTDDKKARSIKNLISDIRSNWKKDNADLLTGTAQYDTTSSSPKGLGKVAVNVESFAANPITTIKLWNKGEPIKKVRLSGGNALEKAQNFFDAVTISERAKGVASLDNGDKNTQVDHIKPKWLGGRENNSNYQILTIEEHKRKTQLGNKLRKQYDTGKITKEEAWKQIQEFNKSLNGEPVSSNLKNMPSLVNKLTIDNLNAKYKDLSPYKQALYKKDIWKQVGKIERDSSLTQSEIDDKVLSLLGEVGISSKDYQYYAVAKQSTDLKSLYAEEELTKMITSKASQDEIYRWLINGRRKVNGKQLMTSGVINYLVDKNIISYADGKALKKISVSGSGKKKTSSRRGKVKKVKKPKSIKVSGIKFPKVKIVKLAKTKAPKISKIKRIRIKRIKRLKYK